MRIQEFETSLVPGEFKECLCMCKEDSEPRGYRGGNTDDLLGRCRDSAKVKARGWWRSVPSLRRYAKPAQVHKLLAALPPKRLADVLPRSVLPAPWRRRAMRRRAAAVPTRGRIAGMGRGQRSPRSAAALAQPPSCAL